MSTELFYDNKQILSGQATPFVGRQDSFVRFGERWADKITFSLQGQITGCTPNDLKAAQTNLINVFTGSFKPFVVKESGNTIFSGNYTTTPKVNFQQSNYAYLLDYTVDIECYKEDLFSGVYGVMDPSDEWSYEEQDDYIVALNHTVSARGFRTNNTAFENAKNFVMDRLGLANRPAQAFIGGGLTFCLKALSERDDRVNGSYSATERYVADAYYGTEGMLRYTSTFQCDNAAGVSTMTVEGSIDGCTHATSMSILRNRYGSLNLYNMAAEATAGHGSLGMNAAFVSNSVAEDPYAKKITFSRSFDNNPDPVVYLDHSVGIEISENEITTVNFQGTIKGRGDIATRWTNVKNYYSSVNAFSYASSNYNGPYGLNPTPTQESITFNEFDAEITISKSWDDKPKPPLGFKSFTYTLNFTPAIQKINATPLANLCGVQYHVVDMLYGTRCAFSINGNGKVCAPNSLTQAVGHVRSLGNSSFAQYCSSNEAILEEKEIQTSEQDISFNFGWSAKSSPINGLGAYGSVSKLSLK